MTRPSKNFYIPIVGSAVPRDIARHVDEIGQVLNTKVPSASYFSTSAGPESVITADRGWLGIDTGSSSNTVLWIKTTSGVSTGWIGIA